MPNETTRKRTASSASTQPRTKVARTQNSSPSGAQRKRPSRPAARRDSQEDHFNEEDDEDEDGQEENWDDDDEEEAQSEPEEVGTAMEGPQPGMNRLLLDIYKNTAYQKTETKKTNSLLTRMIRL